MFEKIREAFSSVIDSLKQRELSEKEVKKILSDLEINLLQCDVAEEVTENIILSLRKELVGMKVSRTEETSKVVKEKIRQALLEILKESGKVKFFQMAEEKKKAGEPFKIMFLGINGTGKTTTVAKFAHMLKQRNYSVIIAAADTHRAGAIEQLLEHASRIGVKVISQKYGSDPAAVAMDGLIYARSHKINVLLIDTAGRMQTNINLMQEMSKIARVVSPDLKILVLDSLTGNDAVSQAKLFNEHVGLDGVVLTKVDADVKGGAALSVAFITKKPILFVGSGQGYNDIQEFNKESFIEALLN